MTGCPSWKTLVLDRERRERDGADPEGWAEALEHFDACRDCRSEALKADPLLVFRRMPELDLPAAGERSEVESMRQAVTAMRTAKRLESGRRFAGWRRWAAAAVLAAVSLSVSQDKVAEIELAAGPAATAGSAILEIGEPPVEGLDRNSRMHIEVARDGSPFVMVWNENVPEKL
ncbi:MAG TPA: hypothetical protein VG477_06390 [Thermoanaerobaculia bacterium]|nr:hypothetical protein [Thermoanaerobaculia bacterium]